MTSSGLVACEARRGIFALLVLLKSASSEVRGGLGGARLGEAAPPLAGVRGRDPFPRSSLPASVASGVTIDTLGFPGFPISSLLPTASLLCALEKVGYDPVGAVSPADERRSISGTATVTFLPERDGISEIEDRVGRLRSGLRSLLRARPSEDFFRCIFEDL